MPTGAYVPVTALSTTCAVRCRSRRPATPAPLYVVGPGEPDWYGGWPANGPKSDWITINPASATGNTLGVYSTTFNDPGSPVPANLCLVGAMGVDDNGELGSMAPPIIGNISAIGSLSRAQHSDLQLPVAGANTLVARMGLHRQQL